MNKGRNIAILLVCLLSISLLTFLTSLNRGSSSGVADGVRYYLTETSDDIRYYDFYFKEKDKKMSGTVTKTEEARFFVVINGYGYNYDVTGKTDSEAEILPVAGEGADGQPFSVFTKNMILSMVYGSKAVLSVTQAIIVGLTAIAGGVVLWKQEELWAVFNKNSGKEYPENKDLKKYKAVGGIIIAGAVLMLIIFVIV